MLLLQDALSSVQWQILHKQERANRVVKSTKEPVFQNSWVQRSRFKGDFADAHKELFFAATRSAHNPRTRRKCRSLFRFEVRETWL